MPLKEPSVSCDLRNSQWPKWVIICVNKVGMWHVANKVPFVFFTYPTTSHVTEQNLQHDHLAVRGHGQAVDWAWRGRGVWSARGWGPWGPPPGSTPRPRPGPRTAASSGPADTCPWCPARWSGWWREDCRPARTSASSGPPEHWTPWEAPGRERETERRRRESNITALSCSSRSWSPRLLRLHMTTTNTFNTFNYWDKPMSTTKTNRYSEHALALKTT